MNDTGLCWQGYARANGGKGIRNRVLILYTVECASFVAHEIARLSRNLDVEVIGFSGCTDNAYAVRLLIALIKHPNIGALLAVGLGCEYTQPQWLSDIAGKEGKPTGWICIQEAGGTEPAIREGVRQVEQMLKTLRDTPRITMRMEDLVVGAECGGSDYTSGLAGNAVVGKFFDNLVDAGGAAIFEEILEMVGLLDFLEERAANEDVRREIIKTYHKAVAFCKMIRQFSISPGNFTGGLSTIEEKSMGAFIKSGTKKIQGVLKVSKKPPSSGLWLLDTTPDPHWMQFGISNPNDNEGLTALAASGCHLLYLVTGRGNVVGNAVAPVLKITGNHSTYRAMVGDMDFDASPVLEGKMDMGALAAKLWEHTASVAGGALTKSESLGHKEYCIPYKYQEAGSKNCRNNGN